MQTHAWTDIRHLSRWQSIQIVDTTLVLTFYTLLPMLEFRRSLPIYSSYKRIIQIQSKRDRFVMEEHDHSSLFGMHNLSPRRLLARTKRRESNKIYVMNVHVHGSFLRWCVSCFAMTLNSDISSADIACPGQGDLLRSHTFDDQLSSIWKQLP